MSLPDDSLFCFCGFIPAGVAFGFFCALVPRVCDFQQCRFILGLHAFRHSPAIVCVSFKCYSIRHRNNLLAVPLMEQRTDGTPRSSASRQGDEIGGGTTHPPKRWRLTALRYAEEGGGFRMKSFERYRRYAADCLTMAQSTTGAGDKALLLQMAETWRHLAEQAEAEAARDNEDK
jgi:hypothetical protein